MRSLAICSLLIVFTFTASAQTLRKLREILHERNVKSLRSFIDRANNPKDTIPSWDLFREINSDYQEGIIMLDGPAQLEIYQIETIASRHQIIFYEIKKKVCEPNADCIFVPEEIFKDAAAYSIFESSFTKTYGASIDPMDLFQTSIIYGQHCGIDGHIPKYQQKLNALIESRDIAAIRNWLRSANAEKQLYAIRAYRFLTLNGYRLTEDELRLLKIVKQKDGDVSVCGGCTYWTDRFSQIVYEIESEPETRLKPEPPRKEVYIGIIKNKKKYTFVTTIGMTLLLFISVYNFSRYFNLRRTKK